MNLRVNYQPNEAEIDASVAKEEALVQKFLNGTLSARTHSDLFSAILSLGYFFNDEVLGMALFKLGSFKENEVYLSIKSLQLLVLQLDYP